MMHDKRHGPDGLIWQPCSCNPSEKSHQRATVSLTDSAEWLRLEEEQICCLKSRLWWSQAASAPYMQPSVFPTRTPTTSPYGQQRHLSCNMLPTTFVQDMQMASAVSPQLFALKLATCDGLVTMVSLTSTCILTSTLNPRQNAIRAMSFALSTASMPSESLSVKNL